MADKIHSNHRSENNKKQNEKQKDNANPNEQTNTKMKDYYSENLLNGLSFPDAVSEGKSDTQYCDSNRKRH